MKPGGLLDAYQGIGSDDGFTRYVGSKRRCRRQLARFLLTLQRLSGARTVRDDCTGSLSIPLGAREVGGRVDVAGDVVRPLISLYRELAGGWKPPEVVSEETYTAMLERFRRGRARDPYVGDLDPDDPLTAFVGFFCSYMGDWWTGFARVPEKLRYPADALPASVTSRRALLGMVPALRGLEMRCAPMLADLPTDPAVVLLDWPYHATKGYAAAPPFDSYKARLDAARASRRHLVVVCEFSMPPAWREVWQHSERAPGLTADKIERAFVLRGGLADEVLRAHAGEAVDRGEQLSIV